MVNRYSLDGILTSAPSELAEILFDLRICKDIRAEVCPKCGEQDWKLEDRNKTSYLVRCRKCRFAETVVAHDKDLFCKRTPLRSAVGSSWLLCAMSMSPDSAGLILGLDSRTVREQWDAFRGWLCSPVERMNNELKVGGPGVVWMLNWMKFPFDLQDWSTQSCGFNFWEWFDVGRPKSSWRSCLTALQLWAKVEVVL